MVTFEFPPGATTGESGCTLISSESFTSRCWAFDAAFGTSHAAWEMTASRSGMSKPPHGLLFLPVSSPGAAALELGAGRSLLAVPPPSSPPPAPPSSPFSGLSAGFLPPPHEAAPTATTSPITAEWNHVIRAMRGRVSPSAAVGRGQASLPRLRRGGVLGARDLGPGDVRAVVLDAPVARLGRSEEHT